MPREALTVQSISRDGLDPAYVAANADGHSIPSGGALFVHVKNDDAASKTITFPTPITIDSLEVAELEIAIPAGEERMVGPFPKPTFGQEDDTVHIDYSDVTSVTVGAFEL